MWAISKCYLQVHFVVAQFYSLAFTAPNIANYLTKNIRCLFSRECCEVGGGCDVTFVNAVLPQKGTYVPFGRSVDVTIMNTVLPQNSLENAVGKRSHFGIARSATKGRRHVKETGNRNFRQFSEITVASFPGVPSIDTTMALAFLMR
jgi:hypothetical protein